MRAVLFDTETTGLVGHCHVPLDRQPRLVELFAREMLLQDGGEWLPGAELELLLNPGIPMQAEASEKTGITDADLAGQPFASEKWPEIAAFFANAGMHVAHNLPFDLAVMAFEQERNAPGEPFPEARRVCTVEHSMHLKGRMLSMQDLHVEITGRRFEGAHRARVDVDALQRIFEGMWREGML